MRKTRVLITGSEGFLGTAFRRVWSESFPDWEIKGVDPTAQPSPDVLRASVFSSRTIPWLKEYSPDVIVHLAGGRSSSFSETFRANFLSTQALFQALRRAALKKTLVVVPGSAAEWGSMPSGKRRWREEDPPCPVTLYGWIKSLQTRYALHRGIHFFPVIGVRFFNLAGYGTPPALALGCFARDIVRLEQERSSRERPVLRTGPLDGVRDFLDVEDLAQGVAAVIQKGREGEIYHICSGRGRSLRSCVRQMLRLSHRQGWQVIETREDVSATADSVGDNRKIGRETGWAPRIPWEKTLEETLRTYRERNTV